MTDLSKFFDEYRTGYEYKLGGDGTDGGIDCSHLVNAILNKAGHKIKYTPVASMEASGNYDRIPLKDAQPGDLVMYIDHHGTTSDHTGIIVSIDPETGKGVYFGSQSSTGPANAKFGPGSGYWPTPDYILRPKTKAAAAPAAVPAKPPLRWDYPAKPQGEMGGLAPAEYLFGLARALGGHYPLGNNGLCHPGIHFDIGSASVARTKEVYAIADGEIIAYRIDKEPLTTRYPDKLAIFDSSFVLIRHKLEMPAIPKPPAPAANAANTPATATAKPAAAPAPAQPAGAPEYGRNMVAGEAYAMPAKAEAKPVNKVETKPANPPATKPDAAKPEAAKPAEEPPPSITLYSLYMHLASWQTYEKDKTIVRPPYIDITYQVKSNVIDSQCGMRLVDKPKGSEITIIPKGCKVVLGEKIGGHYAKVVAITPASAVPAWKPGMEACVYHSELGAGGLVSDKANDTAKKTAPVKVLHVYKTNDKKHAKVIANLPANAELVLGERSNKDADLYKIVNVLNLQGYPELPKNNEKMEGWVDIHYLSVKPYVPPAGVKVIANKPFPVKAGQYIGQFGLYQNHNQYIPQQQIHVELFATEDLKAFIEKCRANADKLDERHKTLVKIPKGTLLAPQLSPQVMSSKHPPKSGTGTPIQTDLYFPINSLNALKSSEKIRVIIPADKKAKKAAKIINWYRLNNIAATGAGQAMDGWVSDESFKMVNPWSFPGFEFLEDTSQPVDLLAYQLAAQNKIRGAEAEKHKSKIEKGANSKLITTLLGMLKKNKIKDLNVGNLLTTKLFDDGLKSFWFSQQTASLVLKTKTQWKKDITPYKALEPVLKVSDEIANPVWEKEQERMQKLAFWEDVSSVTGGADGNIWFSNPVQIISNFRKACSLEEARIRAFLRMIRVGEGTIGKEGYERLFGGQSFIKDYAKDFSDHPRVKITRENKKTGKKYVSSAAGAYQVMGYTWDDKNYIALRNEYKISDFSPSSQDKFCLLLLKASGRGDILKKIIRGDTQPAIELASWIWASLPPSRYGQPIESLETALKNYTIYLDAELSGESDLASDYGEFNLFINE